MALLADEYTRAPNSREARLRAMLNAPIQGIAPGVGSLPPVGRPVKRSALPPWVQAKLKQEEAARRAAKPPERLFDILRRQDEADAAPRVSSTAPARDEVVEAASQRGTPEYWARLRAMLDAPIQGIPSGYGSFSAAGEPARRAEEAPRKRFDLRAPLDEEEMGAERVSAAQAVGRMGSASEVEARVQGRGSSVPTIGDLPVGQRQLFRADVSPDFVPPPKPDEPGMFDGIGGFLGRGLDLIGEGAELGVEGVGRGFEFTADGIEDVEHAARTGVEQGGQLAQSVIESQAELGRRGLEGIGGWTASALEDYFEAKGERLLREQEGHEALGDEAAARTVEGMQAFWDLWTYLGSPEYEEDVRENVIPALRWLNDENRKFVQGGAEASPIENLDRPSGAIRASLSTNDFGEIYKSPVDTLRRARAGWDSPYEYPGTGIVGINSLPEGPLREALGLGAEVILPDAYDLATFGLSIPVGAVFDLALAAAARADAELGANGER